MQFSFLWRREAQRPHCTTQVKHFLFVDGAVGKFVCIGNANSLCALCGRVKELCGGLSHADINRACMNVTTASSSPESMQGAPSCVPSRVGACFRRLGYGMYLCRVGGMHSVGPNAGTCLVGLQLTNPNPNSGLQVVHFLEQYSRPHQ